MKFRTSFVSNSSSASFILKKEGLSDALLNKIHNHTQFALKFLKSNPELERHHFGYFNIDEDTAYDAWDLIEDEDTIQGFTIMTNFDMEAFLEYIGVNMSNVEFNYD